MCFVESAHSSNDIIGCSQHINKDERKHFNAKRCLTGPASLGSAVVLMFAEHALTSNVMNGKVVCHRIVEAQGIKILNIKLAAFTTLATLHAARRCQKIQDDAVHLRLILHEGHVPPSWSRVKCVGNTLRIGWILILFCMRINKTYNFVMFLLYWAHF